jgi:bifunctional DNase/RNase
MEIEMKIRGLMMDPVTNVPIVILKGSDGNTLLPIWVGVYEANAIALEIEKVATPRPMTHDLLRNMLQGLGCSVSKVVVSQLKDDTFYAVIWLMQNGNLISVDSRPSDALALALRTDSPIYVDEEVIKNSKATSSKQDKLNDDELKRWLENLGDEDLGKYKMWAGSSLLFQLLNIFTMELSNNLEDTADAAKRNVRGPIPLRVSWY